MGDKFLAKLLGEPKDNDKMFKGMVRESPGIFNAKPKEANVSGSKFTAALKGDWDA